MTEPQNNTENLPANQTDRQASPSDQLPSHSNKTLSVAGFSGPIPPPSVLEGYEQIVPGSAERIIRMAEAESTHRQALENRVLLGDLKEARLGQIFGFLIGIFAIGCGTYAAVNGSEIAGGFIGTAGVVG